MRRLLLCLFLGLSAPTALVAQDEAANDKGYITSLLERSLSGAGRTVTIDGFAGALSSRATFARLTIADEKGVWLTISDGAMSWSRTSLLKGEVNIDELSAATIDLPRAPSSEPEAAPSPAAGQGFSLPDLPVSVHVGKLHADRVTLGKPILGEPVEVTIDGAADLSGGEGSTQFSVRRIDGKTGELTLSGAYSNATRSGTIDLLAKEGKDGIAVTLLDLPDRPAAELALHGSGALEDFTADLALSTDGTPRLKGNLHLIAPAAAEGSAPERTFALNIAGDISPLLKPEYRAFFGSSVTLAAEGVDRPGQGTDLTRLVLDSAGVGLSGRLNLTADRQPRAAALTLRLGLPDGSDMRLPAGSAPMTITAGTMRLRYNSAVSKNWQLSGVLSGFRRPDVAIGDITLEGAGQVVLKGATADIHGDLGLAAKGIALTDPALQQAVGPTLVGKTALDWGTERPLTLKGLAVEAGDLLLSGDLAMEIAKLDLDTTADLSLSVESLRRFSALAGRNLGGAAQVTLKGNGQLVTGAFEVTASAQGTDLAVDQEFADRLLAGHSDIDASVRRDQTGITIRKLALRLPDLAADGSGTLTPTRQELQATLDFGDLGILDPSLSGSLSAKATLAGALGARTVKLDGSAAGLAIGIAQIDKVIGGKAAVVVEAHETGGLFDLASARFTSKALTSEVEGTAPRKYSVKARLANVNLVVPRYNGPLTLAGTVDRGDGYDIAYDIKGPGGINSHTSGNISADFGQMDLITTGRAELALVNPFITPRSLAGAVNYDLTLKGPPVLDSLSGHIAVAGMSVALPAEGIALKDGTLAADLRAGRIQITSSAKSSSGGTIAVAGPITLTPPFDSALRVTIDRARLVSPDSYDATLSGDLSLTGPATGGAVIGGVLRINEMEITVAPLNLVPALPAVRHVGASDSQRATLARAGAQETAPPGSEGAVYGLDLQIDAPARLFARGRGLDAEMGGQVHLSGTTSEIEPRGAFDLLRGRLNLLGKRFNLDEGSVQLIGSLIPYIDFTASADTFGTTTSIMIQGPANKPEIHFASSSDVPEEEVLSQLLFGNGLDTLSAFQLAQLGNAIATLSGRGGEGIIQRMREKARLNDLDIVGDEQGNAAIKAGKYINDKLYSEATVGSGGTASIDLTYDVNKSLRLKGKLGSDGSSGGGISFTKDY